MPEDTTDAPAGLPPRAGRRQDAASERTPVARAAAPDTAAPPAGLGHASPDCEAPRPSPRSPAGYGDGRGQASPPSADPGVDGETREDPGTVLRPGAGAMPGRDPAGGARPAAAPPAVPNADARQAWKDAVSRLHADQRRGRGRWTPRSGQGRPRPGMNRIPPPPDGGSAA